MKERSCSADVVVVGAGPVGLFLANLLGLAGVRCLLVDRRPNRGVPSMAIGVMPPSLKRLAAIGVAEQAVAAGCRVSGALVHDEKRVLGRLDLSALPPPFPFILSLPQGDLMGLLADRLASWPTVGYWPCHEMVAVRQGSGFVEAHLQKVGGSGTVSVRSMFLAGCDGHDSTVRQCLRIPFDFKWYNSGFVMGDFEDRTGWADEARLFFTPLGAVESFPLPGGRRRWVAQCSQGSKRRDPAYLAERVAQIARLRLSLSEMLWHSSFRPSRLLCRRFAEGRVALCGDAAHIMSPVGGQGMNAGFGDAWHLGLALAECVKQGTGHRPLLADYSVARRQFAKLAAARAARGMWVGTRTGRGPSLIRSLLLRNVLLQPPFACRLPPYFAMLTLPESKAPSPTLFEESAH